MLTEIPINYARKELTQAQFQRRCNRLLRQKLVRFTEEEKKEIESIKQNSNLSYAFVQLTMFLKHKYHNISAEKILNNLKNRIECSKINPERAVDILGRVGSYNENVFRFFNSIIYKPSTNPEILKIQEALQKKGVKAKFFNNTGVDFVKLLKETFKDLENKKFELPKRIFVSPLEGLLNFGKIITGGKPAKAIFINSESACKNLKYIKREAARNYSIRKISTNNPKQGIYHECIHWIHSQNNDMRTLFVKWFSTFKKSPDCKPVLSVENKNYLENVVSKYAVRDEKGLEAIAEIGAGLMDGKTYPKEVMKIYKRLRGPMPKSTKT